MTGVGPLPALRPGPLISRLDPRNWAARSDRFAVLRKALSTKAGVIRGAPQVAADFGPGSFTLAGQAGESNRLSLHAKSTVLCLGSSSEIASRNRCRHSPGAAPRSSRGQVMVTCRPSERGVEPRADLRCLCHWSATSRKCSIADCYLTLGAKLAPAASSLIIDPNDCCPELERQTM